MNRVAIALLTAVLFVGAVTLIYRLVPNTPQEAGATAGWGCRGNVPNGPPPTAGPAYSPARQAASEAALEGTTLAPFDFPLPQRFPGMTDAQWLIKRANLALSCAVAQTAVSKPVGFASGVKPAGHPKCGRSDAECHFCIDCRGGLTCGDLPK